MTPVAFPARITEVEPHEFLVTFADLPEAITGGASYAEAEGLASDALAVAVEGYLVAGQALPLPREPGPGEIAVALEPRLAARVLLVAEMAHQGLSKVGLAERLGRDEKTVRRILSGKGATLDLILSALRTLGVRPVLAA
jgi:antitoxin HicB